jgi:hypothetical protein
MGNVMELVAYHIVTNPDICTKFKQNLREGYPDPSVDVSHATLEMLPYLTVVVEEDWRLSYAVIRRHARETSDSEAAFNRHFPAKVFSACSQLIWQLFCWYFASQGTISMSCCGMHCDQEAFPSPGNWESMRWMSGSSKTCGGGTDALSISRAVPADLLVKISCFASITLCQAQYSARWTLWLLSTKS